MTELAGTPVALALVPDDLTHDPSRDTGDLQRPSRAPQRVEAASATLCARVELLWMEEQAAALEVERLLAATPRVIDAAHAGDHDDDRAAVGRLSILAETLRTTLDIILARDPTSTRGLLRVVDVRRQRVAVLRSQIQLLRGRAGERVGGSSSGATAGSVGPAQGAAA